MKPHKHAEFIKAWADGAEIEFYDPFREVYTKVNGVPQWDERALYRIKPEPLQNEKIELVYAFNQNFGLHIGYPRNFGSKANLKLTFDSETGKLKSAEVV